MCVATSETRLEPGLPIDEIEARLVETAKRHHLEERNMAYWLLEVHDRGLYRELGFSSIGDYARALVEIHPRKAQYLVYIASRLEKLPQIAEAFDAGTLTWTKAREIVRVATPQTEEVWLEKARVLSCHDLEREVRQTEGSGTGEVATLTMSLPVELLRTWNECHELAERLSGSNLEKFQVLEPMMAEFLSTCLPAEDDEGAGPQATDEERALSPEVRKAVFERDGYRCTFPGCTLRKMLDPHHVEFRSHGGGDEPSNLTTICRIHHGLIHRGICRISRDASGELVFERPPLFPERKAMAAVEVQAHAQRTPAVEPPAEPDIPVVEDDDSEDWREETFAAIFDGPRSEKPRPTGDDGDFLLAWADAKAAEQRADRARRRRHALDRRLPAKRGADEHVFAERRSDEHVFAERLRAGRTAVSEEETSPPEPTGP